MQGLLPIFRAPALPVAVSWAKGGQVHPDSAPTDAAGLFHLSSVNVLGAWQEPFGCMQKPVLRNHVLAVTPQKPNKNPQPQLFITAFVTAGAEARRARCPGWQGQRSRGQPLQAAAPACRDGTMAGALGDQRPLAPSAAARCLPVTPRTAPHPHSPQTERPHQPWATNKDSTATPLHSHLSWSLQLSCVSLWQRLTLGQGQKMEQPGHELVRSPAAASPFLDCFHSYFSLPKSKISTSSMCKNCSGEQLLEGGQVTLKWCLEDKAQNQVHRGSTGNCTSPVG